MSYVLSTYDKLQLIPLPSRQRIEEYGLTVMPVHSVGSGPVHVPDLHCVQIYVELRTTFRSNACAM